METNATATLAQDFEFTRFSANHTVNASAADGRASQGPSGSVGGEGHYGLVLVGDANVENCNASVRVGSKKRATSTPAGSRGVLLGRRADGEM